MKIMTETDENTEVISLRFGETEIEAIGIVMGINAVLDGGDLIPHENSMMLAIQMVDWVWSPAENRAINIETGERIPPVDLVKVARKVVPTRAEFSYTGSYLITGELKYDPIIYRRFIANPRVLARMYM